MSGIIWCPIFKLMFVPLIRCRASLVFAVVRMLFPRRPEADHTVCRTCCCDNHPMRMNLAVSDQMERAQKDHGPAGDSQANPKNC